MSMIEELEFIRISEDSESTRGFVSELFRRPAWRDERGLEEILSVIARSGAYFCLVEGLRCSGESNIHTRFGYLLESVAYYSPSLAAILNVNYLVLSTLSRWGKGNFVDKVIRDICKGTSSAAIALTEESSGTDLNLIDAKIKVAGEDELCLSGKKRWITNGMRSRYVLLLGLLDGDFATVLFDRASAEGIAIEKCDSMLAFKDAHLANFDFDHAKVRDFCFIGGKKNGLNFIVPYALNYGRHAVGWIAQGLLRRCLDESTKRLKTRSFTGGLLSSVGTLRRLLARMAVDQRAGRGLCLEASSAFDSMASDSVVMAMKSKYFNTEAANRHANSCVQIFGASGCSAKGPVDSVVMDSKVLQIIEGSSEVLENLIAEDALLEAT